MGKGGISAMTKEAVAVDVDLSGNVDSAAVEEEILVIAFALGNEEYGVEVQEVQEIIKLKDITRVPRAPDYIRGVINLRGNVVPIMDLRIRFGVGESEIHDDARIVIMQYEEIRFGIIVDAVSEVIHLKKSQIEPPPPLATQIGSEYIKGVGKVGGRLIILVDLKSAFNVEELLKEE